MNTLAKGPLINGSIQSGKAKKLKWGYSKCLLLILINQR